MNTVKKVVLIALGVAVLCYAALEAVIVFGGRDDAKRDTPVMIVLGAKVWQNGPSPALVRRLNKAYDRWLEQPDTHIILSGGKGADEPESEAKAMYDYLLSLGVPEHLLHMEDQSFSTVENLLNSKEIMRQLGFAPEQTPVVVVSNAFHLTRVRLLCSRYGLDADTLGTPMPDLKSAVYSYNREVFALIKSFLFD